MLKIATAFIKAKKEFSPALKDKTNPAFRSKYADLGACLEAVNDALLNNGIALIQETFDVESGVTVETVLLHESGECIRSGKLHVPAVKQDPQGYGSALTYARRYSLMAVCGIAPEDDDGNAASKPQKPIQARTQTKESLPEITEEELTALCADKINYDGEVKMGFKSLIQSGQKTPDALINWLSKKATITPEIKAIIESWESIKGETA